MGEGSTGRPGCWSPCSATGVRSDRVNYARLGFAVQSSRINSRLSYVDGFYMLIIASAIVNYVSRARPFNFYTV
eukprot:467246-Pleurochrysis_carterae.AAC.1